MPHAKAMPVAPAQAKNRKSESDLQLPISYSPTLPDRFGQQVTVSGGRDSWGPEELETPHDPSGATSPGHYPTRQARQASGPLSHTSLAA